LVAKGVITMSSGKVAATLAAVALLGGALWFAVDGRATLPRGETGRALASAPAAAEPATARDAVPTRAEVQPAATEPEPARTDAAAPVAATTGSLRVHVLWADQTAAPGVLVETEHLDARGDESRYEHPRATSDEQGVARIAGLRPGRAYAHAL